MADNIGDQSEFLAAHEDVVKRVLEQQPMMSTCMTLQSFLRYSEIQRE